MKPLLLTICYLVGIFSLPAILAWLAAFAPWLIATILILGLVALSLGNNWQHYAASINQGNNFDAASADAESFVACNDPNGQRNDKQDTTKGGGVTSRRPLHTNNVS